MTIQLMTIRLSNNGFRLKNLPNGPDRSGIGILLLGRTGSERKYGGNLGAGAVGVDLEASAELCDALVHALNPDASFRSVESAIRRNGHAAAAILNSKANFSGFAPQGDAGIAAAGVAVNVGERFLHDAEDGHFHIIGKAAELGRDCQLHL